MAIEKLPFEIQQKLLTQMAFSPVAFGDLVPTCEASANDPFQALRDFLIEFNRFCIGHGYISPVVNVTFWGKPFLLATALPMSTEWVAWATSMETYRMMVKVYGEDCQYQTLLQHLVDFQKAQPAW